MARYVVRLAKSAGIVVLFVLAAFLGTVSGVLFAFAGDLPRSPRWTTTRRAPSRASTARAARSSASSPRSGASSSPTKRSRRSCGRRSSRPRTPDFERHFGLSVPHIFMAATRAACGRACAAPITGQVLAAARRQHHHPAAGARALPGGGRLPDRRRQPRAQDQGSDRRGPDREALHQERDLHLLRQPDVSGRRRLRRRGGRRAPTSASPRRTSTSTRPRPSRASSRPGATRPRRTWSAPSGASPTSSSRWRTRASSRRRRPTTPRRGRSCWRPRSTQPTRSRRTSSRKSARSWKARYGAKALYENGLTVQTGARPASCRRPRTARSTPASAASITSTASASRAATSLDERHTRRRLQASALGPPVRGRTTSSRPSSPTSTPRRSACAPGDYRVTIDKKGFAWTRQADADAARAAAAISSKRSC